MQIRYVCSEEEHRTDAVLEAVAQQARALGIALAGTIQPLDRGPGRNRCDIVLGLLPNGDRHAISFDLPPEVPGCRLDAEALEAAVGVVQQRLAGAQALVVNKFGKQEATGRGLVPVIGEACDRGLPVLIGVAPQWRAAFLEFADQQASPLPADAAAVLAWLRQACLARIGASETLSERNLP